MNYWSNILATFWLFRLVEQAQVADGFSPLHRAFSRVAGGGVARTAPATSSRTGRLFDSADADGNANANADANTDPHQVDDFEDWSDERKSSLFQFLLRDLEIEGVPLLGCDGVSANMTLQGATWTVAGQLSENEYERKVCLVLEDIPVRDLKLFVNGFSELKSRVSMMDALHDLRRFSLSLVGNGIGPGLILETANKTATEIADYSFLVEHTAAPNEKGWMAAMESFVGRCFPELAEQSQPMIAYRFLGSLDVCDILSGYWNCICELEAAATTTTTTTTTTNTIVLSFPPTSACSHSQEREESHTRFAAISELLNAMNSLYESEYKYELVHLHPSYDRDDVHPGDEPANGHLVPTSILRDMIRETGDEDLSEEQLALRNYQRRSPLPGVIIKRASSANADGNAQIDCQSAIRLAKEGEEKLQEALVEEQKLISESN
eukprot:CAMPEP_0172397854 /NCGR_PEP_ID=MMETSP1061-20121228/33387_1 /TAXON_ID=37318 /ORGANISM="Pseudo-nitzschia pungens, Strain cf. pungens" /LENGTH=436 /DNA_ID=CAMNT_0013130185 /DNA_START=114 /DNA_END=1424 /DNA_ORIENTATION=+